METTHTVASKTDMTTPPPALLKKRVMIAGIGNIFMKDDGFGSAVVQKMSHKQFPEGVELKDFGTGGLKLAYDLMKGYDGLIFIDASARGGTPGTMYLIEPSEDDFSGDLEQGGPINPHDADPATVLRFVKSIGAWPGKVSIIACEPQTTEDFSIGLSESVNTAIDQAIEMVDELIQQIYSTNNEAA